jgi:hypothetical protein
MEDGMRNGCLAGAVALLSFPALAQNAPPVQPNPRIVGVVEQVTDHNFTVRADDGKTVTVNLDQRSRVVSNTRLNADGIHPGDHFASDVMKGPDGKWHSTVGHTQPEPFGNNALWFHPIAGHPGAMRILGIVETVQKTPEGAHVKVKYDMGDLEFEVPSNITLYHVSFDGPSILKPGLAVNAAVDKSADGAIAGRFITVEKNGTKPIAE